MCIGLVLLPPWCTREPKLIRVVMVMVLVVVVVKMMVMVMVMVMVVVMVVNAVTTSCK